MNGGEIFASYGLLTNIEKSKITHKCNTNSGSSGSPILLLKNNQVMVFIKVFLSIILILILVYY